MQIRNGFKGLNRLKGLKRLMIRQQPINFLDNLKKHPVTKTFLPIKQLFFIMLIFGLLLLSPKISFAQAKQPYPQRIISFYPALTEEIYLLGAKDTLVGCTVYCQRPPETKKKEKIGTVMDINVEKVFSLQPDLVVTAPLNDPKAQEKLKNLGITIITFPIPNNFNEVCSQLLKLSSLLNKENNAEKIITTSKNKIQALQTQIDGLAKPRLFFQIGVNPLVTINKDSFLNDFIELAGGVNVTREIKNTLYSREKVLKDDPDVIIIATMGIIGEEEKKTWQTFKTIKAVKDDRIYLFDAFSVCSPTPISFVENLQTLAKILHSL